MTNNVKAPITTPDIRLSQLVENLDYVKTWSYTPAYADVEHWLDFRSEFAVEHNLAIADLIAKARESYEWQEWAKGRAFMEEASQLAHTLVQPIMQKIMSGRDSDD